MYQFVYLLKTIAAALITNSHFDDLYPISAMSVGGSLGNSIFFLVSGFLISTKIDVGFFKWYLKRCMRIYPAYWVINIVYLIFGVFSISTFEEAFGRFILPIKSFWFVGAILIFYAIFYFVIYSGEEKCTRWIILTTIVYFIAYIFFKDISYWSIEDSGYFKFIFYFDVMLFGYMIKINFKKINKIANQYRGINIIGSIISLLCFVLLKVTMIKIPKLFYIQFLVQVITLLFSIFVFMTAVSLENILLGQIDNVFGKMLSYIADSTLEIYLVNYVVANWAKCFSFPINVILAFVLIFGVGTSMHYFISVSMKRIVRKVRDRKR